jgi:hypothetical protein
VSPALNVAVLHCQRPAFATLPKVANLYFWRAWPAPASVPKTTRTEGERDINLYFGIATFSQSDAPPFDVIYREWKQ